MKIKLVTKLVEAQIEEFVAVKAITKNGRKISCYFNDEAKDKVFDCIGEFIPNHVYVVDVPDDSFKINYDVSVYPRLIIDDIINIEDMGEIIEKPVEF